MTNETSNRCPTCESSIQHFREKANRKELETHVMFIIVIIATLSAPLFVTLGQGEVVGKVVPAVLSLFAAGSTSWLQLRKPQQLWIVYRTAERQLEESLILFSGGAAPFNNAATKDAILAERVAAIRLAAHERWTGTVPDTNGIVAALRAVGAPPAPQTATQRPAASE